MRPIRADDDGAARHLSEQLLEDARAGIPRRVDRCAAPIAAKLEMAKQSEDLLTGSLDQRVDLRGLPPRRPAAPAADPAPPLPAEARRDGRSAARGVRRATSPGRRRGVASSSGRRCHPVSTPSASCRARSSTASSTSPARRSSSTAPARISIRLSFSAPTPERIREGVTRLAAAVREEQRANVTGQAAGSAPPPRAGR